VKRFALVFMVVALVMVPAANAQNHDPSEAGKIDREVEQDDDMFGWRWANFAVLAGAVVWLAMKYGKPYFTGRTQTIREGLEEARRQREDAEIRSADIQLKLANIEKDIDEFRCAALAEQGAEMERMRRKMTAEVEATWSNASQNIEILGKHARLDLRRFASNLAMDLAEQRIRQRMNPSIQAALTGDFVEKLKA
jgi:F-type H+-transporting ATPase subunit b